MAKPKLYQDIDTINSHLVTHDVQLAEKANQSDLDAAETNITLKASQSDLVTERARIDNLIANVGNTSGNSEIIDIRTDSGGIVNSTAGAAVRNIDKMLKDSMQSLQVINQNCQTTSKSLYYNFVLGKYYKISVVSNGITYSLSLKYGSTTVTKISNKNTDTTDMYIYCDNPYTEVIMYNASGGGANPGVTVIIKELSITGSVLEYVRSLVSDTTIINVTASASSTSIPCIIKKGVKYKLTVVANGITYSSSLLPDYPNTTGLYTFVPNTSTDKTDYEFIADKDYTGVLIWNSSPVTGSITYTLKEVKLNGNAIIDTDIAKYNSLKIATVGDSITSNDVTGIGTRLSEILGTTLVGNFAEGFATCSDFQTSGSPIDLSSPANTYASINVLSNQIRRMLQNTTALGSQITWTHNIDGAFNIDTAYGTGLGNTTNVPNIVYIAIGTNDGVDSETSVVDDTETVFGQSYSALTRKSVASALRWAIETLQSAYPNATIFVASPLQTSYTGTSNFAYAANLLKRNIIEKVCRFCSVKFIDNFSESGFSRLVAYSNGQVHPNGTWKEKIAKFVAHEIKNKYVG